MLHARARGLIFGCWRSWQRQFWFGRVRPVVWMTGGGKRDSVRSRCYKENRIRLVVKVSVQNRAKMGRANNNGNILLAVRRWTNNEVSFI
jgi:hypothetical protein